MLCECMKIPYELQYIMQNTLALYCHKQKSHGALKLFFPMRWKCCFLPDTHCFPLKCHLHVSLKCTVLIFMWALSRKHLQGKKTCFILIWWILILALPTGPHKFFLQGCFNDYRLPSGWKRLTEILLQYVSTAVNFSIVKYLRHAYPVGHAVLVLREFEQTSRRQQYKMKFRFWAPQADHIYHL